MPDIKKCPSCNTENPIAANFCRRCRYKFSEKSKNGLSLILKIVSFNVLEKNYDENSYINVSWVVQGATELWLNGKEVTNRSSYYFQVQKTRTLALRAKNEYSETHKEIILRPSKVDGSSNNNDDDWNFGCGIVIAIIIAFFIFKSCDDDPSSIPIDPEEDIIEDTRMCESDSAICEVDTICVEPVYTTKPISEPVDFTSLRETIKKWNSLRIATITDTGEGAAVYGTNGFSCHNAPEGLYEKLHSINKGKYNIVDLNIVDKDSYVVIFDTNAYSVKGAPQAFMDKLHEFNSAKETIYSASFNNNDDWVIITNKHYSWSNSEIRDFCRSAQDNYGNIKYMFISDYGKVACCERGIYYANLPSNVEQAIDNFKYTPSSIKFTDSGKYAIANERGASAFNF